MRRRNLAFDLILILIVLSVGQVALAEDLPNLHDRISSTLYGRAYRMLFLGQKSIPAWIKTYNSTSEGTETPGLRVYFDGEYFERYRICDAHHCDTANLTVLYTPGGRQAWAISMLDGKSQFFGYPDAVTKRHLIASQKQP